MPPQPVSNPGGFPARPGPRPAPVLGAFVTHAPKEKRNARIEYGSAAVASIATFASLASLIFLNQLKLDSVVAAGLLVLLVGLLVILRGRER